MIRIATLVLLVGVAVAQRQEVVDDGSYDAERYEIPYLHETSQNTRPAAQPAVYSSQPAVAQSYQPANTKYVSDARNAAILSEARYLQADGKFGASYSQEDGVQFKEEADPDGTRRGTYSYVDPSGQRRTVSYTAGKFGFQASGDHLPSLPAVASAAPQQQAPAYRPQPAPQPQYQAAPQPQYQPAPQPQYQPAPQAQYQPAPQPAARYRPAPQYAVSEPETYSQPQPTYSQPRPQYRAQQPQQPLDVAGPSHPTITQSSADSYSISAAF